MFMGQSGTRPTCSANMKNKTLIKEIFDTDFDSSYQMSDPDAFKIRRACRGILINENKIALLNVTKHNYHKLPGGGIEKGEPLEEAFKRELLEEVGADCEIIDQGGIVVEWRDKFKLLQISYVFLAKVIGEVKQNNLDQDEIDDGFELKWVPVEKLNEILENDSPTNYEGNFIRMRDMSIVKFYKNSLKSYKV